MNTFQSFRRYLIAFGLALMTMILLLFVSSRVPKSVIRKNMMETADYLCEKPLLYNQVDFLQSSRVDHYADSIWLSIAYFLGDEKPMTAISLTSYYDQEYQRANYDLLEAVKENISPNTEYLRYWHGATALLRLQHVFLNVRQIYFLHAFLLAGFFLMLMVILIRNRFISASVSFAISMVIVSAWFVPLCLEYTYCYICLFAAAIIAVHLAVEKRYDHLGIFFMLVGMVTVYLDFLTTETLTLLIPLMLILHIRSKQGESRHLKIAVKSCLTWGIGYAGMWVSKWIFSAIVLRQNVLPYITGHIEERIGGGVPETGTAKYVISAIIQNLKCLFPYEYGIYGAVLLVFFGSSGVPVGKIRGRNAR